MACTLLEALDESEGGFLLVALVAGSVVGCKVSAKNGLFGAIVRRQVKSESANH